MRDLNQRIDLPKQKNKKDSYEQLKLSIEDKCKRSLIGRKPKLYCVKHDVSLFYGHCRLISQLISS